MFLTFKMPEELINSLQNERIIATLSTFSSKGEPHSCPLLWFYPKGDETLLLCIPKDHKAYENMIWQKKAMVGLIYSNNIMYSVLGRLGVVRAPSCSHPAMAIIRMDICKIKCDRMPIYKVEKATKWSYTSRDAQEMADTILAEFKELIEIL